MLSCGAQTIHRIIYPAETGVRINYEMRILPKHDLPGWTSSIVMCIDKALKTEANANFSG